jgi:hypothetical protein
VLGIYTSRGRGQGGSEKFEERITSEKLTIVETRGVIFRSVDPNPARSVSFACSDPY